MGHQQVYDLCFRAKNSKLQSKVYRVEFLDWIKAGIAFNTRGTEVSTRKISYFGGLYELLGRESDLAAVEEELRHAVIRYYEDLYGIYQQHLKAQLEPAESKGRPAKAVPDTIILLPSFTSTPGVMETLSKHTIVLEDYECENKKRFIESACSVYLEEGSELFRCMSLLYDYGPRRKGNGILLEVIA